MCAIDSPAKADSRFWMVTEAGLWKGLDMGASFRGGRGREAMKRL
jgi:hypothetical protein